MVHHGVGSETLRLAVTTLMLLAVPLTAGCNRGDRLKTYEATGKVTFPDGRPLWGGSVTFHSADHQISATAAIQPDGTFRLRTYDEGDGAVAGRHLVSLMLPPSPPGVDPDEDVSPPAFHPKYQNVATSGLEFVVSETGENHFPVRIKGVKTR